MANSSNPFSDLIPNNAQTGTVVAKKNPFDDLVPRQTEADIKAEKVAKLRNMLGIDKTPVSTIKNILAGMATGGQNIATTLTGGYAPTVDVDKTFGISPSQKSELLQGVGQYLPVIASGGLGLLPDIALNTAYGATQSPDSPGFGAAVGGGSSAGFGILNALMSTASPITRAVARSLMGAGVGYGLGGNQGAAIGAGAGFIAPSAMRRIGIGSKNPAAELVGMVDPAKTLPVAEAGERLGTPLSPGEASGRPDITSREATFGRFGDAASERTDIGERRIGEQQQAIKNLYGQITPQGGDAAQAIREAAQTHIKELKAVRQAEAEPYYKASENDQIPQDELDQLLTTPRIKNTFHEVLNDPDLVHELGGAQPTGKKMIAMVENRIDNLLTKARAKPYNQERIDALEYAKKNVEDYSDPRVQSVLQEIYKNDPVFQATALGIDTRSIKFLDTVKKRIDTASENLASSIEGKDRYKAKLIGKSAQQITDIADKYSPNYRLARSKFEQASPMVDEAEQSVLGRIANLSDVQLKNASKMIFDPSQTNIRVLAAIKKQIMRRNPDAWDRIVRNEMERLNKRGQINGVGFYRNVLANDNQFNQFELALDHNPEALQTLRDMKKAWKNLINVETPRTAFNQDKTAMNTRRETLLNILDMVAEQIGTKQHKEALNYIYSPRWVADMQNLSKIKTPTGRSRQLAIVFAKILPPSLLLTKPDNSANEQKAT